MGQLIATIINVMVLLLVPAGILQIHAVVQTHNELLEIGTAATKYISNNGGTNDATVEQNVRQFVHQELSNKLFQVQERDLQLTVTRTKAADPVLWSHEDEFELRLEIPFPRITGLFPDWGEPIIVVRSGTVQVMDYDL
ncbi:hypothetical protein [Brevibacillus sp. H7]|jgi:hypothetical protein|uniref:hypothetical protein n=1 Tax=Brevibacillus sp. H7 TaxID=3349138 RepID=UPI00381D5ADC